MIAFLPCAALLRGVVGRRLSGRAGAALYDPTARRRASRFAQASHAGRSHGRFGPGEPMAETDHATCAPYDPNPRRPRLQAPPGACDCHAHVFGPASRYPYSPKRGYTPPDAPFEAYRHMHDVLGIERGVFTQPSVYGTDNRA